MSQLIHSKIVIFVIQIKYLSIINNNNNWVIDNQNKYNNIIFGI